MKNVKEILSSKGSDVWSVSPDNTIFEALKVLADKQVGAVVVTEGNKLVGIMSERDYARKVVLLGKSSKDTPVREIMTTDVVYVTPDTAVEDCMALMGDKRIRHLPVLVDEELVGVISIGDVVNSVISDKEFTIAQLERYVHGG